MQVDQISRISDLNNTVKLVAYIDYTELVGKIFLNLLFLGFILYYQTEIQNLLVAGL